MSTKPKFRPEIRRIKLNPEQAVLTCTCYAHGHFAGAGLFAIGQGYCTDERTWTTSFCDVGNRASS